MNIEEFILGLSLGYWNYLLMFIVAFLESIPFLGLLIPGQTIVIMAGFGAHIKIFNLSLLIIVISLAAITGDCLTYYLGRKYGLPFLRRWGKYFFFKEKYIQETGKLIINHLGKSLIIGRLHSFTRSFAPFLAGVHKAPFSRFLGFTIIGGILWALTFSLIGYFIGESFRYFERYLGIAFILIIILALCWHFFSASIKKNKNFLSTESKILGAIIIISLFFFTSLIRSVIRSGFWTRVDERVYYKITEFHTTFLTFFAQILDILFDTFSLTIISLLLIGFLLQKKKNKEMTFFAVTMIVGLITSEFFKWYVHRARPSLSLAASTGFSFPSGHALISTVFLGLIVAYLFMGNFSRLTKQTAIISATFLIILVGTSRVYLNVHWFSDVIAGITLGIAIFTTALFFWVSSEKIKSE